ncbi:energy transducer TonB [Thermocrinis sp.]
MKDTLKAYSLSLLIHSLFFLFFLLLNQGLKTSQKEMIEIDLSFENFEVFQKVQEEKAKGSEKITDEKSRFQEPQKGEVSETKQQVEQRQTVEEYKETPLAQNVEEAREEPSASLETSSNSSEGFTQARGSFTQAQTVEKDLEKSFAGSMVTNNPPESFTQEKRSPEAFLKEKFSVISSLIQSRINYPLIARRMGWEGKVLVSFVLEPSGEIRDLKVLKGSGFEILDREALEGVKRSYRNFPRPPVEVLIKLPVVFKLE